MGFSHVSAVLAVAEPSTYKEASGIPEWQNAMSEELAALDRTSTWEIVPLPSHAVPITCKWVFKIKTKSDGSLERYKARLVARGFQQTQGRDYEETFAPVAHMTTIRTMIAVAASRSWTISQMDVKNAFLHGELHEEVYMHPPPGVDVPLGQVCRLRRALYGLKQAPRAWYERFVSVIIEAGFSPSPHDPALFIHTSSRGRTLLLLYVDDMLSTGDDAEHISLVERHLSQQFQMTDLGPLSYFLGIEVSRSDKGYYISQSKYIQDLIARSGITDTRTAATPMDIHLQLRPTDGTPLEDPARYRHIVGSLVYLTVTRPDIAHAVHILSQFVNAPTSVHFGHFFAYCDTYVGQHLEVYFMLMTTHFSFMLIQTPHGPVIQQIAVLSLVIVFFLVLLLLPGSPRSRLLSLALVQRQNLKHLLLLLLRLFGFDGYWPSLEFLVIPPHLSFVITLEPFRLLMIL